MTSTLFDHVKDAAIYLNQTKHLLQVATHRAHETFVKNKYGKTKEVQDHSTRGTTKSKVFIDQDGNQHSYLVAPEDWKHMTAVLICIKTAKGFNIDNGNTVLSGNTTPASSQCDSFFGRKLCPLP